MIRKLTEKDLDQYKRLRLLSLKNDPLSWLSILENDLKKPDYQHLYKLNRYPKDSVHGFYGYFNKDKLLGYIQLTDSTLAKKRHIVYIFELCVDPKYRRKDVGSDLVKHVIKKAKTISKVEQVHLYVNSNNTNALNLYRKLGFKIIASQPKAVKEIDNSYQDEIILSLNIS